MKLVFCISNKLAQKDTCSYYQFCLLVSKKATTKCWFLWTLFVTVIRENEANLPYLLLFLRHTQGVYMHANEIFFFLTHTNMTHTDIRQHGMITKLRAWFYVRTHFRSNFDTTLIVTIDSDFIINSESFFFYKLFHHSYL